MDITDLLWLFVGLSGVLGGFLVGYFFSPASRTIATLKEQVTYWQGLYGNMKKRRSDSDESVDGITKLLSNPLVQLLIPHIAQRLGLPKEVIDALVAGKLPNIAPAQSKESEQQSLNIWS